MASRYPNTTEPKDTTDTDESLMLRLRDGEDLALNALMSRWERSVISFAIRYTSNQSDAIDLAQETFVRIYENRKRYRPKGKFSTWMFTITANLCRNHARWKTRHPSVSTVAVTGDGEQIDWADSAVDPGDRPDGSALRGDDAREVRRAVQSLPHDLRTAVILFEFESVSHADIAKVLGCTPKAIETRLYRARQLLREKLAGLAESLLSD